MQLWEPQDHAMGLKQKSKQREPYPQKLIDKPKSPGEELEDDFL